MTSDAKIGLLLGLVFIFVIAFIINGLPHFRDKTDNNELTTNMVKFRDDSLGLVDKERKAQETLDGTQLQQKLPFEVNALGLLPQDKAGGIRFQMPLPGSDLTVVEPQDSAPIAAEANGVGGPPTIGPVTHGSQQAAAPAAPAEKIYVVREGDILAEIAKKVYGPVEGKKQANIDRIFQANRNQLKSPARIQIGQKLVIPPLPTTGKVDKSKPADVLTGAAFENVESVGERRVQPSAREPGQTRWYVVQDGDSLWKISASQLGNGSRYTEILKLNSAIVKNEDDVAVGMRLKMPAK